MANGRTKLVMSSPTLVQGRPSVEVQEICRSREENSAIVCIPAIEPRRAKRADLDLAPPRKKELAAKAIGNVSEGTEPMQARLVIPQARFSLPM